MALNRAVCILNCYVAMPKVIQKAKIACLDFSLQKAKMHLGVQVVIEQPDKLEAIRDRYLFLDFLNQAQSQRAPGF